MENNKIHEIEENFNKKLGEYNGVVLFIGHGSKNQYKKEEKGPLDILLKKIDKVVEEFNKTYNNNWIAVYGGDKNQGEHHPDIGYIMYYLKHHHRIPIAAIIMKDNSTIEIKDAFWLDLIFYTEFNKDINGQILYGGLYQNQLVGATKVYLGDQWTDPSLSSSILKNKNKKRLLDHVMAIGGGNISFQEIKYAFEKGISITYLPAEIHHQIHHEPDPLCKKYGPIHQWALEHKEDITILSLDE
ncbi:hypothetical protein BJ944DRAFT_116853 [Cunninghamella echinulata]|nr:hypothetical protein BJ944DRAFT_116853 [Cunninghamella echinulata]